MAATLYDLIPRDGNASNSALLDRFLDYVLGRGLQLYPAQEEAILELFDIHGRATQHTDRLGQVA